ARRAGPWPTGCEASRRVGPACRAGPEVTRRRDRGTPLPRRAEVPPGRRDLLNPPTGYRPPALHGGAALRFGFRRPGLINVKRVTPWVPASGESIRGRTRTRRSPRS